MQSESSNLVLFETQTARENFLQCVLGVLLLMSGVEGTGMDHGETQSVLSELELLGKRFDDGYILQHKYGVQLTKTSLPFLRG